MKIPQLLPTIILFLVIISSVLIPFPTESTIGTQEPKNLLITPSELSAYKNAIDLFVDTINVQVDSMTSVNPRKVAAYKKAVDSFVSAINTHTTGDLVISYSEVVDYNKGLKMFATAVNEANTRMGEVFGNKVLLDRLRLASHIGIADSPSKELLAIIKKADLNIVISQITSLVKSN